MAVYNAITGHKRRMPHCLTNRKKRKSTSSTVAGRMFAEDAIDVYFTYIIGYKKALIFLLIMSLIEYDFESEKGFYIGNFFILAATMFRSKVV